MAFDGPDESETLIRHRFDGDRICKDADIKGSVVVQDSSRTVSGHGRSQIIE
jgi:hypothetical protein